MKTMKDRRGFCCQLAFPISCWWNVFTGKHSICICVVTVDTFLFHPILIHFTNTCIRNFFWWIYILFVNPIHFLLGWLSHSCANPLDMSDLLTAVLWCIGGIFYIYSVKWSFFNRGVVRNFNRWVQYALSDIGNF